MQQRALAVFLLLLAPATAAKVSTESAAEAWLKSHKSPTDDQLGELKNANPDAYAMVKALLTKHSMGLVKLSPSERGPDVFRKMMGSSSSHLAASRPQVDMPYANADMGASPPVDNMHYNPKAAADKDEMMVDRLLGAVAGLSGAKGRKIALLRNKHHKQEAEDPFAKDMADWGVAPTTQAPAAVPVEEPQVEQQPAAPAHKENSYLKGLDLSGDMPMVLGAKHGAVKQAAHHESTGNANYLAGFSFDDGMAAAPEEAPKPKQVVAAKPKKDNSFLKWLGLVKKAPAPEEAPVVAAQPAKKPGNPYLVDFLNK